MKASHYFPFLSLFLFFLAVGFWTGTAIGQFEPLETLILSRPMANQPPAPVSAAVSPVLHHLPKTTQTPEAVFDHLEALVQIPEMPTSSPIPGNGQRNILVIGVDQFESLTPHLESVWLILYVPRIPRLTLMPLYPTPPHEGEIRRPNDSMLESSFHLTPEGTPAPDFLAAVRAKNLWWSGYVLMDKIALIQTVDFLDSMETGTSPATSLSGAQVIAGIPPAEEDPQASLQGQAKLIQRLCRGTRVLSPTRDAARLADLFGLLPHHVATDMNVQQATTDLQRLLSYGGALACEFPSLAVGPDSP